MKTTNKVQTGDTITGTSTNTSYINSNHSYKSEKGWECPRCGRINAPWVRQCDCSPSTYTSWDKITVNPCDKKWWTEITCSDDNTFKIHPESITYNTNINQIAGGSDYKDPVTGDWVNVPKTYTNTVKR